MKNRGFERRFAAAAILCLGLVGLPAAVMAESPEPSPPVSSIGNETVFRIVVSPAYLKTGLVVASSHPVQICSKDCDHLWVTRDGGAHWKQAAGSGWNGSWPVIAADKDGHEHLFSGNDRLDVQQSDDYGESWRVVGDRGTPTVSPNYADDGLVVVAAGRHDYILQRGEKRSIPGSGAGLFDTTFAFMPTASGNPDRPPILVAGLDNTNPQHPLAIERCTSDFVCSGPVEIPNSSSSVLPVSLSPSSDFVNDGVVFLRTSGKVYKSADAGATFAALNVASADAKTSATAMMALAPDYRESGPVRTLYVSLFEVKGSEGAGGVFKSQDGGATWANSTTGTLIAAGTFAVAVAPDGRLFAGFLPGHKPLAGLLCSVDGVTWSTSCPAVGSPSKTAPISTLPLPWIGAGAVAAAAVVFVLVLVRSRARRSAQTT